MSVVDVMTSIFSEIWRFMSGFTLPVVNTSPAGLLVGVVLIRISISVILQALGLLPVNEIHENARTWRIERDRRRSRRK